MIPGIRGIDGCLSQGGPVLWVGFDNFDPYIFGQSSEEEAPGASGAQVILGVFG